MFAFSKTRLGAYNTLFNTRQGGDRAFFIDIATSDLITSLHVEAPIFQGQTKHKPVGEQSTQQVICQDDQYAWRAGDPALVVIQYTCLGNVKTQQKKQKQHDTTWSPWK